MDRQHKIARLTRKAAYDSDAREGKKDRESGVGRNVGVVERQTHRQTETERQREDESSGLTTLFRYFPLSQ